MLLPSNESSAGVPADDAENLVSDSETGKQKMQPCSVSRKLLGSRPLGWCPIECRSFCPAVSAAPGLTLDWLWILVRSAEFAGAARTAFLTEWTFPLETIHTEQKSGAALEMLEGTSEVLNLVSTKIWLISPNSSLFLAKLLLRN